MRLSAPDSAPYFTDSNPVPATPAAPRHNLRCSLSADRWPADCLQAVPAPWRSQVFRALARVLHPDCGGTTALAACLNGERDRMEDGQQ
jgi:hypothetical protein